MTSRTLQRFLVAILLVGALVAPTLLTALASMPVLRQAGTVVIDFEDLDIAPGRLVEISDQYADLGVTFNNPEARDFASGSSGDPDFVHSGSNAVQQCFSTEFCETPLIMTFSEPQRRVRVWVGYDSRSDEARQVTITGFDVEQGGDEVATASATLGPSDSRRIPVQTPLEITADGSAFRRIEVGFSPPSEAASSLVFDDVEFEPDRGVPGCPAGTPAPEITLDLPANGSEVQTADFTLQGSVESAAGLSEATLTVANKGDISPPQDVLSRLPQEGGAFGPILINNALLPGENTVTLTVSTCAGTDEASARILYSPIADGTQYEMLGLEVTQTIQDTGNSVILIAGKKTYVRVYLRAFGGTREIRSVSGKLRGCYIDYEKDDAQPECLGSSSELLPALEPLYRITVNDADDLKTQRENLQPPEDDPTTSEDEGKNPMIMNYGLMFELPPEWTRAGHLRLQFDAASLSPLLPCLTCDAIAEVEFLDAPPLALNLVDVAYESNGGPHDPREIDYQRIESWLERAYPTDKVIVTTLTELEVPSPLPGCHDINAMLFEAVNAGTIASPPAVLNAKARYYGLVAYPSSSSGAYVGCAGILKDVDVINQYAVGPAGTGPAHDWDKDGSFADFYAGHEIAHTFKRKHPGDCESQGEEDKIPEKGGFLSFGEEDYLGFDVGTSSDDIPMTIYLGFPTTDVMTYCPDRWISSYTYFRIYRRMIREMTAAQGLTRLSAPAPDQQVLLVSGIIDLTNKSIALRPFSVLPGEVVSPRPDSSRYNIDLRDAAGNVTSYPFDPRIFTDQPPPPAPQYAQLTEVVPWIDGTVSIDIRIGKKVIETVPVTTPPQVELTAPNGGERLGGGDYRVTWTAFDREGADLTYTLLYSADDGVTWQTAAGNITDNEFLVDPDRLPGSDTARFRIIATDGVGTAQDDSDFPVTVANKAPRVSIASPADGASFTSAHTVVLTGNATDVELGELDGAAMQWTSDIQGPLGEGRSIGAKNMTPGLHTITLTANDGVTPPVTTSISITITDANPPHLVWPDPLPPSQLRQGQFFYDGKEELGAFYTTDGAGGIQHVRSFDVLLNGWTDIVPGDFGGDETTDLLFYASQAGVGEFFSGDGAGGLQLLSGNEGFTRGWDLIVPGNFDDDSAGWTDLFFYNAEAGEGKFYTTDGTGRIRLLGTPGTFHTGWTSIVAGEFGGDDHTDLLFYDKAAGLARLYTTDGLGGIEVLDDNLDWTAGWDQIVSGNFGGGDGLTDLFLYDAETGNATFLAPDSTGALVSLGEVEPFSTRWTSIVSGDFGGDKALTDLFFYDAEQGLGRYYLTNGQGGLEQLSSSSDFPVGWDQIVPGYFETS